MIQASLWKKNRIPTDAELEQIQELLKQLQKNSDEPPPSKKEISLDEFERKVQRNL